MPSVLITCVLLLLPQNPVNYWHILAEVSFKKTKDRQGLEMEVPIFSKHLRSYEGKKIKLKGYLIPLSEVNGSANYMFSSLPFSVCYFCGAAGPETVVELQEMKAIKFTTKPLIIEGTLFLNDKDPDHHIYLLKSPVILP